MPHLYSNGTVSDRTVNAGTPASAAVLAAAVTAVAVSTEANRESARRAGRAANWLLNSKVTPIGVGVDTSVVLAAASNEAGHAASDINAAVASQTSGGRFVLSGTTLTRRF